MLRTLVGWGGMGGLILATALGQPPNAVDSRQVVIDDPQILAGLESAGWGVGRHFGLGESPLSTSAQGLMGQATSYASLVEVLTDDLDELLDTERRQQPGALIGVGMAFTQRVFDSRWFSSPKAKWALVGVINRLDRVAFSPTTCGELRFVYRLSYSTELTTGPIQSRLPLTLLVKYEVPRESGASFSSCREWAQAWRHTDTAGAILGGRGVLAPARGYKLHSIETNIQALRIPATARAALSGHAVYILRVFKPSREVLTHGPARQFEFVPTYLENTPDVAKLKGSPELRRDLKSFLLTRTSVNRLDNGILQIPERFLATKAFSYSPYGMARKDNRLFHQILSADEVPATSTQRTLTLPNGDAFLRRLNDMSCVGCHQGRATAGFHFLGRDGEEQPALNSLVFAGSGHLSSELRRRTTYLSRVMEGRVPSPFRDFSFAPRVPQAALEGEFCGLPSGTGFRRWQCALGLRCESINGPVGERDLGQCVPTEPIVGSANVYGSISQADHRSDQLMVREQKNCAFGGVSYRSGGGFPNGICYAGCDNAAAQRSGRAVCVDFAGNGFNQCIGAGQLGFVECLRTTSIRHLMGRCDAANPCRNDYVCVRASEADPNSGYCSPSYFLFQIRLDGHPRPN